METRRRRAVRLGMPALFVAALAIAALWRVGPPPATQTAVGTTGSAPADNPLTRVADTLLANAIGRKASLEDVVIREITTPATFWVGAIDEEPVFAVLATSATRAPGLDIQEGTEVTLIGVVRPAPDAQDAMSRWHVDARTAAAIRKIGTYLEVTEVR